ncbi:MAG: lysine--tRNA ligase, partial [Bryobacteraceae bacterium]|nr:lysine--tRNA ligase [Bryobacteraceae bacterium]
MSLEQELLAQRLERVREIEKLGFAPYGHRFDFTHTIPQIMAREGELDGAYLEANPIPVKICGRIQTIRRMGKAGFMHLEQGGAKLQIYCKKDALPENDYALYQILDFGDIVGC